MSHPSIIKNSLVRQNRILSLSPFSDQGTRSDTSIVVFLKVLLEHTFSGLKLVAQFTLIPEKAGGEGEEGGGGWVGVCVCVGNLVVGEQW